MSDRPTIHLCTHNSFWQMVHDPRVPFFFVPEDREFGIADIESETIDQDWWRTTKICVSRFCPWCGVEFPASLKAERIQRLTDQGIDPSSDAVPEPFKTDQWWREAGL